MIVNYIQKGRLCLIMQYSEYKTFSEYIKPAFLWNKIRKEWHSREIINDSWRDDKFMMQFSSVQKYFKTKDEMENKLRDKLNEYSFLLDFQKEYLLRGILSARGYGYFFDVGLGKTLLGLLTAKFHNYNTVFVTINPLLTQVKEEALKWNLYSEDEITILSAKNKKREEIITNGSKLLICPYSMYQKYIKQINSKYKLAIYDEASKLKNYKTKLYTTIFAQLEQLDKVYLLTGTPIENNILDLFNICRLISPDFISYTALSQFLVYETKEMRGRVITQVTGCNNIKAVLNLTEKFSHRLSRKNLKNISLNNKIEKRYFISLNSTQRKIRKALIKYAYDKFESRFTIFTLLRMLDNGATEFSLSTTKLIDELQLDIDINKRNMKLETLTEIINEIGDEQILIFAHFKVSANLIVNELKSQNYDAEVYTSEKPNDEAINLFKEGKLQILIATDALSYGANFPNVNNLIHYDILPNPAKMIQRVGRIDRLGTANNKIIFYLISEIVEEHIYNLMKDKTALITASEGLAHLLGQRDTEK